MRGERRLGAGVAPSDVLEPCILVAGKTAAIDGNVSSSGGGNSATRNIEYARARTPTLIRPPLPTPGTPDVPTAA